MFNRAIWIVIVDNVWQSCKQSGNKNIIMIYGKICIIQNTLFVFQEDKDIKWEIRMIKMLLGKLFCCYLEEK